MYSTHSGSVPDFVVTIHTTKLSSTEFTFSTLVLLLALWLFAILQFNPRAELWVWRRCDVAQSSSGPYRKFNIEAPPASLPCLHLLTSPFTCFNLHLSAFPWLCIQLPGFIFLLPFVCPLLQASTLLSYISKNLHISTTCSHLSSSRMHCLS